MSMRDYGVAFKADVKRFDSNESSNSGLILFLAVTIVVMIGAVVLFVFLRGNERFSSKYEEVPSQKISKIVVKGGSRVYYAPFDDEGMNTDIGLVPEYLEFDGIIYSARYIPNNKEASFVGVSAESLRGYDYDYINLDCDIDGIVWFHKSKVEVLPPNNVP